MRNITLSAADEVIDQARDKARAQGVAGNEGFRKWIASYVQAAIMKTADNCFRSVMQGLPNVDAGSDINRDEMKECWL